MKKEINTGTENYDQSQPRVIITGLGGRTINTGNSQFLTEEEAIEEARWLREPRGRPRSPQWHIGNHS